MAQINKLPQQRFNTQPPEGGWEREELIPEVASRFNTQPPEGGWLMVLTIIIRLVCFNTQPPEGGWRRAKLPIRL